MSELGLLSWHALFTKRNRDRISASMKVMVEVPALPVAEEKCVMKCEALYEVTVQLHVEAGRQLLMREIPVLWRDCHRKCCL